MAQTSVLTGEPGLYLVGEYIGLRDQRPRIKVYNDVETTFQGCDVGLRVDGSVETVGYQDRPAAEAAVEGWVVGETRGVKVRTVHGVNDRGPWLFYSADVPRVQSAASFEAPGG